ncbi:asparagine synthase [Paenibacillus selenitireducens]|uniref:Asparagine synthase n=1 Tax=Paenibacillus selenitireducens TaxID=1324314 RepID=A0A1T2XF23_9BACL|nr:asparagine synthase [Paenibacillus selenitireducens]OPA78497.1 asparagine synthase [Paenibacillus selenitireducens]
MREGLIPTILGSAVSATGATLLKNRRYKVAAAGVLGFGLAHVVLGVIDLLEHR